MALAKYPGQTFYPTLEWTVSGLVGTMGLRITRNSDGATVLARSTAGITEFATSAEYTGTLVAPTTAGEYTVRWDDGSTGIGHVASEDLIVSYTAAATAAPAPGDLCTVAQVKSMVETATTATDALIQTYITAASAEIQSRYQTQFADGGSGAKSFEMYLEDVFVDLAPYGARAVTSVVLRDPGQSTSTALVTLTDFILRPLGGWQGLGTFTRISFNKNVVTAGYMINYNLAEVVVTGSWGPATTPVDIADAAASTVASWLDKAFADYGQSFVEDNGRYVRPDQFQGWRIPGSAHGTMSAYDRRASSSVL